MPASSAARAPAGAEGLQPGGTSNPLAYQEYLDGRLALDQKSVPAFWRALEHFREATQADPNYARAYGAISETYINLAGNIPAGPAYANAKLAAQKALQLDDRFAEAHRNLAWILFTDEADVRGAEREYRRALELNPKDARTHHWYSQLLIAEHRPEEALREAKEGLDLDPLSLSSNYSYGFILIDAGHPEAALVQLKELLAREPNNEVVHGYIGLAYLGLGEYGQATQSFRKAMEISALKYQYEASMAYAMAKGGDKAAAQTIADTLQRKTTKGIWIPAYNMAVMYAGLGETEKAFYWLNRCVDDHSCSLLEVNTGPIYQELRHDPRFSAIANSLGAAPDAAH